MDGGTEVEDLAVEDSAGGEEALASVDEVSGAEYVVASAVKDDAVQPPAWKTSKVLSLLRSHP